MSLNQVFDEILILNHFQLKRLFETIDVESPTLALSGKRFFFMTKSLILAVSMFQVPASVIFNT